MPFSQEKFSNNPPANEFASQPSTENLQPVCRWSAPALQPGWSRSPRPLPGRRAGHTLTATANAAGELFLFGGLGTGDANGDVLVFRARNFSITLLQTSGEVPAPRYNHGSALIDTTLLIYGGQTYGARVLHDDSLYLLNLETRKWSRVVVFGPGPGDRCKHTTNVVGSKLFVFGGSSGGRILHDMWTLDLNCLKSQSLFFFLSQKSQPVWESHEPTPGSKWPLPRCGHVSVTTGDHIIIFGGKGDRHHHNDTWSFDILTRKWTELQCTGSIPSPRAFHAAVLIDGVMYVYGGHTGETYLDDLIGLQLAAQKWIKFYNVGPSPQRRPFHTMASDGSRVFVLPGNTKGAGSDEIPHCYVFDTKDIKYLVPERNAVNPNENTTQLARKSSTGPSTQEEPQHPTSSSSDAHGASPRQKASPAVSCSPASPQITREQNPGPNASGRLLKHTVIRDPEDIASEGSTEYHAKFSAPDSSSDVEATRFELEQQLSVSLSVQTEQGQRIARLADELAVKCALLEQAEANAAEGKRAILELREHEDRLVSQTSLVKQRDAELVDTRSKLRNAEAKLDKSLLALSQQIVRYAADLANVRAELETKRSELEAVHLRHADADDDWARSKTKAGKLRMSAANLIDLNEERDMYDPKDDKQVIEAGLASPQWNEKSRDG